MMNRLGQTVRQKREAAGLSHIQLALMTGLTVLRLQELEQGGGEPANFEICRTLAYALSAKTSHWFVLQDLWLACSVDKYFQNQAQLSDQSDSDRAA